jgi:hypothetical protein
MSACHHLRCEVVTSPKREITSVTCLDCKASLQSSRRINQKLGAEVAVMIDRTFSVLLDGLDKPSAT